MSVFIFTCGDINGIGPEICIKTLNTIRRSSRHRFIFICPENVFFNSVKINRPKFEYDIVDSYGSLFKNKVTIINTGNYKPDYGTPNKISGRASFKALEIAYEVSLNFNDLAIITAPVSKLAWSYSNIKYYGHTELFAKWYGVRNYAMMFLSKKLKATLLTIHQPIRKVSRLINKTLLSEKFGLIVNSLKNDFKIKSPRIAVLGLNPHAGENGIIGDEEKNILIPFMKNYSEREYFFGPFSPDAFWGVKSFLNYDMVIGMYHDQILNPFKLLNFNSGVNYTAGLPIVRTSPDHGTAFDIAGKGIANESSMVMAFKLAKMILQNRNSHGQNS